MNAMDFGALVREQTEESMKVWKAAHAAGYLEGYRAATADARRVIEEAFALKGHDA